MIPQFEESESSDTINHSYENEEIEEENYPFQDHEFFDSDQYEEIDASFEFKSELVDQNRIFNQNDIKCILDEINCMICFHVVTQPVCCELCEALFCLPCIREWFFKSPEKQICPCCRTDSLEYFNQNPFEMKSIYNISFFKHRPSIITNKIPKVLVKLLSKIKLTCKNQHNGCLEILNYEERSKHESLQCHFALVICSNNGCSITMLRHQLQSHLEECSHTLIICRYCELKFKRNSIEQHHQTCEYQQILCKWCNKKKYLFEIYTHENECSFKRIMCDICKKQFYFQQFQGHSKEVCYRTLFEDSEKERITLEKQNSQLMEMKEIESKYIRQGTPKNFKLLYEDTLQKIEEKNEINAKLLKENEMLKKIIQELCTKANLNADIYKTLYGENQKKVDEMKQLNCKLEMEINILKEKKLNIDIQEEFEYSLDFEDDDDEQQSSLQEVIEEQIEEDEKEPESQEKIQQFEKVQNSFQSSLSCLNLNIIEIQLAKENKEELNGNMEDDCKEILITNQLKEQQFMVSEQTSEVLSINIQQ